MQGRKKKPNISAPAKADIKQINAFTRANWGEERRKPYMDKLSSLISAIGINPRMGRPAPELGEGYRKISHHKYWVIYKTIDQKTYIYRVLHGSRDLKRHLEKDKKRSKGRARSR